MFSDIYNSINFKKSENEKKQKKTTITLDGLPQMIRLKNREFLKIHFIYFGYYINKENQ